MNKKKYTQKEATAKLVFDLTGDEQIRFTIEEIEKCQKSSDPFTDEELRDIVDNELALGDDMDTKLIDYLLALTVKNTLPI